MPRKSPDKYLLDMVLAGRRIQRFLAGYDKQRFVTDEKTISAVERQCEILGEAARQVDETTRQKFPEIDFQKIVGMRNIIAHDYENVRVDMMWSRAEKHVPELIRALEPYLARLREREQEREPPGFER
jgi:uncharacterized protein with HEPN domain